MRNLFILFFLLSACNQSRNFDNRPDSFDKKAADEKLLQHSYIQFMYSYRPTLEGFGFTIFVSSGSGQYGSSVDVSINEKNGRVTLGNLNIGKTECSLLNEAQSCNIIWNSSVPYYGLDLMRYQFRYEFKELSAVLNTTPVNSARLGGCELEVGGAFYLGKRLKITIEDQQKIKSSKKFEIFNYDFGSQNSGAVAGLNEETRKYYYSFDFDHHFNSKPYYFDTFDAKQFEGRKLIRIAAKSLDEQDDIFVQYCFYEDE